MKLSMINIRINEGDFPTEAKNPVPGVPTSLVAGLNRETDAHNTVVDSPISEMRSVISDLLFLRFQGKEARRVLLCALVTIALKVEGEIRKVRGVTKERLSEVVDRQTDLFLAGENDMVTQNEMAQPTT